MVTYNRFDVVFQEIPNETTLAFTIEGCPNNCVGCHSPHLREQGNKELTKEVISDILLEYQGAVTCILFLGGDAFHDELYWLADHVKEIGYKTAFYSGNDILDEKMFDCLDYYKVGSYNEQLGGLNSRTTNQRLYKKENNEIIDITEAFWNEKC